jgi:hypothetical protein
LKDVPHQTVAAVEIPRLTGQQALHRRRQIGFGRFKQQVKMIRHQTPRIQPKALPLTYFQQGFFKFPESGVLTVRQLATIPPRIHVVKRTFKLQARRARHAHHQLRINFPRYTVQLMLLCGFRYPPRISTISSLMTPLKFWKNLKDLKPDTG